MNKNLKISAYACAGVIFCAGIYASIQGDIFGGVAIIVALAFSAAVYNA